MRDGGKEGEGAHQSLPARPSMSSPSSSAPWLGQTSRGFPWCKQPLSRLSANSLVFHFLHPKPVQLSHVLLLCSIIDILVQETEIHIDIFRDLSPGSPSVPRGAAHGVLGVRMKPSSLLHWLWLAARKLRTGFGSGARWCPCWLWHSKSFFQNEEPTRGGGKR